MRAGEEITRQLNEREAARAPTTDHWVREGEEVIRQEEAAEREAARAQPPTVIVASPAVVVAGGGVGIVLAWIVSSIPIYYWRRRVARPPRVNWRDASEPPACWPPLAKKGWYRHHLRTRAEP